MTFGWIIHLALSNCVVTTCQDYSIPYSHICNIWVVCGLSHPIHVVTCDRITPSHTCGDHCQDYSHPIHVVTTVGITPSHIHVVTTVRITPSHTCGDHCQDYSHPIHVVTTVTGLLHPIHVVTCVRITLSRISTVWNIDLCKDDQISYSPMCGFLTHPVFAWLYWRVCRLPHSIPVCGDMHIDYPIPYWPVYNIDPCVDYPIPYSPECGIEGRIFWLWVVDRGGVRWAYSTSFRVDPASQGIHHLHHSISIDIKTI